MFILNEPKKIRSLCFSEDWDNLAKHAYSDNDLDKSSGLSASPMGYLYVGQKLLLKDVMAGFARSLGA
jgi:hypothetical protein